MFLPSAPMERGVTIQSRAALHSVPDPGRPGAVLGELAAVLWQERELLEDLLYALVQQQRVLSAGEARWLPRADALVAAAARGVQDHEVLRAIEVETLAPTVGLAPTASLLEIANCAEEPWSGVLHEHRAALRGLAAEVEHATAQNRSLLLAGERSTRDALEQAGVLAPAARSTTRYDGRGTVTRASASVLDEHA